MYYSSYFLYIIMSRMVSKNLTSTFNQMSEYFRDCFGLQDIYWYLLKVITLATSTRLGMKRIHFKRVISICQSFSVQWCELACTQREQWYMPLQVKRLEIVMNPPPPLSKLLSTPKTLPPTHLNCSFFRSYVFLVLLILLIKYIKCKIQK